MSQTIIVSGPSGFIAQHLIYKLLHKQYKVIGLSRPKKEPPSKFNLFKNYYHCDDPKKLLNQKFKNHSFKAVVHTATQYHAKNGQYADLVNTNIALPVKLLDLCKHKSIKKFINCDSFYAHSNQLPSHYREYSLCKKMFREWINFYPDLNIQNLILGHVFGPNDNPTKFTPWFFKQLLSSNTKTITLSPGEQKRDFIFVDDVIQAIYKSIQSPNSPGIQDHFIGRGDLVSIKDFCILSRKLALEITQHSCPQLNFGKIPYHSNEIMLPPHGDKYIRAIDWSSTTTLEDAIKKTILSHLEYE